MYSICLGPRFSTKEVYILEFKKLNCPVCKKELIRLEPLVKGRYEFYCDDCDIDISIDECELMEEDE